MTWRTSAGGVVATCIAAALLPACGGSGSGRDLPAFAPTVDIGALQADDALDPDLRDVIREVVLSGAAEHEGRAGSYEPFVAVDPDVGDVRLGEVGLDHGTARAAVVIANPANRAFTGSVLCMVSFRQQPCDGDRSIERVSLEPGRASVVHVRVPASDRQEVTVVLLVDDDRVDPLPASQSVTLVAGDAASGAVRTFPSRAEGEPAECEDAPSARLESDALDERGHLRADRLSLTVSTCEPEHLVSVVFVDRRRVLPAGWSGDPVTVDGRFRWDVGLPPGTRSVQAFVFRFPQPPSPDAPVEPLAVEEVVVG
jgi:hypothetical protein